MYKVGDRIRVIKLVVNRKNWCVKVGDTFYVAEVDNTGGVYVKVLGLKRHRLLVASEIEKVEENTNMTFLEMAQKLIDGEFEEGAEVTAKDRDGDIKTYYVGKNQYGYGLADSEGWFFEDTSTNPSSLNGRWEIVLPKEEPIKEMSIEELQKELGYKIKIVERG